MIECKICNKKFKAITHKHLKTHNITMQEYKKRYPYAKIVSEDTKNKLSTNNLSYWVAKHGKEKGTLKYNDYLKMLSEKNTFKYKKEKYGWDKEKFEKYNKSRAITLENQIKKYGEKEGRKRYYAYVEKQRVNGCKLEYFIELLGEERGRAKYKEVNQSKAHTLDNYIKRYESEEVAKRKLQEFFSSLQSYRFTSEKEADFISLVTKLYNKTSKIYSVLHGGQYGVWSVLLDRYIKCDLAIPEDKIVIEFLGNYWHCNPTIYDSTFIHPHIGITAGEIWKIDSLRKQTFEKLGFRYYTVWEREYDIDKENTMRNVMQWMQQ